jgi:hypothetical protein
MNPASANTAWHRLATAGLLALLLGCDNSQAVGEAAATPSAPSADTLRLAAHLDYVPPPGSQQECLGRLIFTAPKNMEWGISPHDRQGYDRFRFTKSMGGPEDVVDVGNRNVRIVVTSSATWDTIERLQRGPDNEKHIAISEYRRKIEINKERISDLAAILKDPSLNINNNDVSKYPESIKRIEKTILDTESSIAGLERDWHPMNLGMPQALGYAAGPTLYAFLLRDGRAYQFMSSRAEGDPPFEEREKAFFDLLKRFRTRALYEIPAEPGICIPYGFIQDDGTEYFRADVSFRYKDRPGVIYSLGSRIVGEHNYFGENAMLMAATRATGVAGSAVVAGRDAKAIGPRAAKIGALEGWQGGASVNTAGPGKPPVRNYSVYTAYDGHPHSRLVPSIRVELRSFTKAQEETLKEDPPPIEESLQRLDTLLQSIRLRPTTPAMPGMPQGK